MTRQRLALLASLVLAGVFLYAAWDKVLHPAEFARIVYRYQVIGPSAALGVRPANLLAVTLPWIEVLIGLLLLSGVWRREAALLAGGLLLGFVAGVASALYRGIDLQNCGCFSVSGAGRSAGLGLIVGDLLLLGLCVLVAGTKPAQPVPSGDAAPAT